MKLAFLQLLILSFDEWFNSKNTVGFQDSDFYELRFYTVCFATFIGNAMMQYYNVNNIKDIHLLSHKIQLFQANFYF